MTEQAALDEEMSPAEDANATAQAAEAGTETQADSAPATDEGTNTDPNYIPEDDVSEKVRARLNKITADKYAEKRRADALQAELDQRPIQPTANPAATGEPKLEDFDFDETAHMAALIDYKVNQKAAEIQQSQQQQVQANEAQARVNDFQAKVVEFQQKAPDFEQVIAAVPTLPSQTLDAVMKNEKGPELAYYLGKHLDVADEIVNMSPIDAAMKLGEISARLTAPTKTVNTSAAPEPIDPINTGAATTAEISGPPGAKFE